MYLSMTPANLNDDVLAIDNTRLIDLLRSPPNFRQGGWGIYRTEPRPTPDGLVSEFEVAMLRDSQRLELLSNGHLELSIKIDQRRFDIEHVRCNGRDVPTLYLYPLCEIPLNFLRLSQEVWLAYKGRGIVVIRMGLYNIRGYSLCAHGKNTEDYQRQLAECFFPVYEKDHLRLSPKLVTVIEPGTLAKSLAEELWERIGFKESPPLFDEQGNFRP